MTSSTSAGLVCSECNRTGFSSMTYIDGRPICTICISQLLREKSSKQILFGSSVKFEPTAEPSASGELQWFLVLNKYQRDNLVWLFSLIGFGRPEDRVAPFDLANTGDWVGEIPNMLAKPGDLLYTGLDASDSPNCSIHELRSRVSDWLEKELAKRPPAEPPPSSAAPRINIDLEVARAGLEELKSALDSLDFAGPETQIEHRTRAAEAMNQIGLALMLLLPQRR